MGASRNSQIDAFAEKTGIKSATGRRAEILQHISEEAFELIKIVELEISGIRDGDGFWGGSDPLTHFVSGIDSLFDQFRQLDKVYRETDLNDESIRKEVAEYAAYCVGSTAPKGDDDPQVVEVRMEVLAGGEAFDFYLPLYLDDQSFRQAALHREPVIKPADFDNDLPF